MTYSDELKVCWFTPQRTATRTTHTLLRQLGFISLGTHVFNFPKERYDYRLISNIRNPYSRLVSTFFLYSLHKKRFDIDFKKWCDYVLNDEKFAIDYQLKYHIQIKSVGRNFDNFIRVESYAEDLKKLDFIDLTNPEIKDVWDNNILKNGYTHEFKSIQTEDKKTWYDFYDEEIADSVFSKLEEQFDFFGYEKNSWKNGTP
jgi:hypothetical protein